NLEKEIKEYKSILLAYGEGSIKKYGLYQKVVDVLKTNKINFCELSGIKPNPRLTSVKHGIDLCRKNKVDFILAVGAGSTIDCAKAVAFGYYYEGDVWDFFKGKAQIKNALPLGTILTLPATGSEMNGGTVISNEELQEKLSVAGDLLRPLFSILDPVYTMTLPKEQTAAGVADIMAHVFEQYYSPVEDAYLQNRLSEAILKTCIEFGPIAIKEPENYEARANLMWAGSLALNGLLSYGKIGDWAVHNIEHEISAIYDLTHGTGLAIIYPNWMNFVLNDKTVDKFAEYAKNVFGINGSDKFQNAKEGINKTREFFDSIGLPSTLSQVKIGSENLNTMAEKAIINNEGEMGRYVKLGEKDVLAILKMCV
ncbi:MAG: iron-containing alcohol dehydrogenase, partial [Bacteroidales bacterium]|nr:iron-containing alcohol dehydrogenase [Bacteroidales bacterium]